MQAASTGTPIDLSPGFQLINLGYIEDTDQKLVNCIDRLSDLRFTKNYLSKLEYFTVGELVDKLQ
jgi:hypothetical protein